MLSGIVKYSREFDNPDFVFSILIPTWNNLEYLKLCISSIRENSDKKHQLIVLVNEGSDGTLEWLETMGDIDFIHAKSNIGICYGLNICRSLVKTQYIVYANDDMFFLPGWDNELIKSIKKIGHNKFMLSSTMIEPFDTGNPSVIVNNFGTDIENFKKEELLNKFKDFAKKDWNGSTWPPNIVHVDTWDLVGGMSVEFSPGMYSDPDLSMKLWQSGVRYFKGVGKSRVYHFGSKSVKRVKKNKGKKMFLLKWGITSRFFVENYLKRGQEFKGELPDFNISTLQKLINRIKLIIS